MGSPPTRRALVDGGADLVPQSVEAVERNEAPTATSQGTDASAAGGGAVDFLQLPPPVAEVRRLVLVDAQLYVLGVVPLESVGNEVMQSIVHNVCPFLQG